MTVRQSAPERIGLERRPFAEQEQPSAPGELATCLGEVFHPLRR
jgi:hypothetical protein